MNVQDYVKGLRALADLYEAHSELPIPYDAPTPQVYIMECDGATAKQQLAKIVRELSPCDKSFSDEYFSICKKLDGGMRLRFFTERSQICERIVVGTKHIEAAIIPARDEEIVEWRCNDTALLPSNSTDGDRKD